MKKMNENKTEKFWEVDFRPIQRKIYQIENQWQYKTTNLLKQLLTFFFENKTKIYYVAK